MSHIEGYNMIQKFACEESERYSTKISKSGTGNGILVKKGISYNILEWGCY